MKGLGKIALMLAVICFVALVLMRLAGYADHRPMPIGVAGGVAPSAFQRMANTLLLFSIAFYLAEITGKAGGGKLPKDEPEQQPAPETNE